MKLSRFCLFGALALAAASVSAQSIWKWRDQEGHTMVSDRPPPADIPERNILQRPGSQRVAAPVAAAAEAASLPASGGMDKELEARKRKLLQDQVAERQAKVAADKERLAAQKTDDCRRARNQLTLLQSGARVARPNAQGEREFLDDKARAEEVTRMQQQINTSCN